MFVLSGLKREEKSFCHVAIAAKILHDNKPKKLLTTVFIRLTALALIKFLELESGRLFEVGAYARLGAY